MVLLDKVPSITRLFRCFTCKRVSHYEHLPQPPGGGYSNVQLATHYQKEWNCADCASFIYPLEHILAWRPFPENAIEPSRPVGETPNYKANLPREYLVKWMGRSYRRIQWVPHGYLLATAPQKLRSFLTSGSRIKLLDQPVVDASVDGAPGESGDAFDIGAENAMEDASSRSDTEHNVPTDAVPDAEKRIHPSWRTVDRVLDVRFWYPEKILEDRARKKKKTKRNRKSKAIENDSDDFDEATHDRMDEEYEAVFDEGRAPSDDFIETIDSWEKRTGAAADTDNIELVVWAYFKWDELGYEHGTLHKMWLLSCSHRLFRNH